MRVTFLSTVHPHPWAPEKGTFNSGMLLGLSQAGIAIQAIVPVPWTERRGNAVPLRLEYPTTFPVYRYVPRLAPLALAAQLDWSTRRARSRPPERPDLVLAYWTDPDGTVAARWANRIGVPFVQLVGGSDILAVPAHSARGRRIDQTLARAAAVVTVGQDLRQKVIDRGLPPERVSSLRRDVDQARFHHGDRRAARALLNLPLDRPVLLWVGRMVPIKGLPVLFEAMREQALAKLSPLLVLVGDGPERRVLEAVTTTMPPDAVQFVGKVPHHLLPTWYQAADLTVLPSLSEGVPNVLLESIACGTDFVATDVGSIHELTDNRAADLVPPGQAPALAGAIVRKLSQPAEPALPGPTSSLGTAGLADLLHRVASDYPAVR